MKFAYQIVTALLLLMIGVSGADCSAQGSQMSAAERVCCQQMTGQCDMDGASKHSCCHQFVLQRPDAVLKDGFHQRSAPVLLPLVVMPGRGICVSSRPSFVADYLLRTQHNPPGPSVEILRV